MSDARKTVLVVEDDAALRKSLLEFLEDEGYRTLHAENGRQALDLLDRIEPPSLILLDLMMPVMDGWAFLAAREAAGRQAEVPVVLLSGFSFIRDAPGIADFLSKPIHFEKLRACLDRLCRTRLDADKEEAGR